MCLLGNLDSLQGNLHVLRMMYKGVYNGHETLPVFNLFVIYQNSVPALHHCDKIHHLLSLIKIPLASLASCT